MSIKRIPGNAKGRCRAVVSGGLVYTVATDATSSSTIVEQTRLALETIEQNLVEAGSSKSNLLQVTIYLRDMSTKAEMDAVWCEWIGGQENWPQRATIGVDLAGNDLIEIVVTAALS
ncbi:MAG: RidA family protein [Pseudomonadota bacterium]